MNDIEVRIYNAENTTSDTNEYGYNSWREYWEKKGGDRNDSSLCPMKTKIKEGKKAEFKMRYRCPMCKKTFLWDGEIPDCFDGCHVQIEGDKDETLYITPLCHGCNHAVGTVVVPRRMLKQAPLIKEKDN